ncbi:dihydroxyacetone kinase [Bosea sp. Root381]|uniref:dihydroxyacetone kinase family protein n=1 Tax=Bosea sp. Root381 TaxID=1736524 RepID=UPI0006FC8F7F|nr:dihydroxyacetone kinase family protein [Bosea sp. Root381]KRD96093.1 dihydroxyacetone kinase [Bosea sp. Root381]
MKKLINDPRHVVREMLEGLVALHPGLAILADHDVVLRSDLPEPAARRVAVISGGGAGHEPAHAGYVGAGMLHAAVSGDVFTSPSVDAVLAAIHAAAGPAGALLVVKNYTGDRLNFGLAAELARASGIPTEIVVVADDVALRETVPEERRRGIAGTVLIHKIVGALAEQGASLAEIAAVGRSAVAGLGTMGVALGACTIPAVGTPGFTLGEDEIELGLGIHGEAGVARARIAPADAITDRLLDTILTDRGFGAGARVALLVNNLGGTTTMELSVVARRALARLRERGLVVERAWAGTLLSALEMPGCSLSVMKVDDDSLGLLDRATAAPAWPGSGVVPAAMAIVAAGKAQAMDESLISADALGAVIRRAALAAASALTAAEPRLTELDSQAGDGDLGISMSRAAAAVQALCARDESRDAAAVLALLAAELRRVIGGSSGPFYAVGLLRAARRLAEGPSAGLPDWADAFAAGVAAVSELGGARAGDRTMLDALLPAAEALSQAAAHKVPAAQAWDLAAEAAQAGAEATTTMKPRLGRASYLGERALGVPDGGAVAVSIWLAAAAASAG